MAATWLVSTLPKPTRPGTTSTSATTDKYRWCADLRVWVRNVGSPRAARVAALLENRVPSTPATATTRANGGRPEFRRQNPRPDVVLREAGVMVRCRNSVVTKELRRTAGIM